MLTYNRIHSRNRLSLNGIWNFWKDPEARLDLSFLKTESSTSIAVPAPWQSQSPELREYTGVAWYQRSFELLDLESSQVVILGFDAVDYSCEVWVNGHKAGEHEGGYLPFELDITNLVQAGVNQVAARVSDSPEIFDEIPHGKQSWYGPLSGIWQEVWIEVRPSVHIQGIWATPDREWVNVEVVTNQSLPPGHLLVYEIYSPDGDLQTRMNATETRVALHVAEPQLWDIDSPNLYTIRVSLVHGSDGHVVTDSLTQNFGFRNISTRDGKIHLNDRPIYLRGALDQDYYPDLIYTPPSQEYIEAEFLKAKEMGLNCLRVHIKVADPRYYQAADKVGILIWSELPNASHLCPESEARLRQTIEEMIRLKWNHPSLIIWTIINESWGVELSTNPDHRDWLAEMYSWVKTLDPHRLVVDNSPCFPNCHVKSDIDDFHFYASIPFSKHRWDRWVESFARRAPWIYHPYWVNAPQEKDFLSENPGCDPGTEKDRPPLIVSEFGNWGLPDLKPLLEHYQGEPWWFETGWDWGNSVVYPHGAGQRFYALNLDKVFGDYSGLASASQQSQYDALKYEIEAMRLQPTISGYIITELTDLHWECNGLLDMLRNEKVYHNRLADLNADTLIIPRVDRWAYWEHETVSIDLHLSHYGKEGIREAILLWELQIPESAEPLLEGRQVNINIDPACVAQLPRLTFRLPEVAQRLNASLVFRLTEPDGMLLARNHLELALYPSEISPTRAVHCPDADLRENLSKAGIAGTAEGPALDTPMVVREFDDRTLRFVQEGGRVLFLAETPQALLTRVPDLELKLRRNTHWDGDWVGEFCWVRKDIFAQSIPGDGHLDMSFSSVIPQTVISSTRTRDFDRRVLAGMFVGWLRSPVGLIQRFNIGRGLLVVSTLQLNETMGSDPVARELTHALIQEL
jgi:hypothetical protein